MNGSEDAVLSATEVQTLVVASLVGAGLGFVIVILSLVVLRIAGRRSPFALQVFRRVRIPLVVAVVVIGLWIGFVLAEPEAVPSWYEDVKHGVLIVLIVSCGWLAVAALGLLKDASVLSNPHTGRDVRRFRTQAQVLRRTLQFVVVFLTVAFVLLTFPEARAPMMSLLASAGILSVVVGFAAQSSLGNMFAGLQLAFSDALRVGDTVVVPGEDQPGTVEEITLTYIVVRTWDERRLVIPSTEFTSKPFQNWTRRATKQLGNFRMKLDWTAPVAEIRAEVERLLFASPLWDKRTWTVQIISLDSQYLELRVIVSAENWAKMWDLCSYLRENLVAWIRANAPWAIPRERYITENGDAVERAWPTDTVLPDHLSAPTYTGPSGGGYMRKEQQQKIKEAVAADGPDSSDQTHPVDSESPGANPPAASQDKAQALASLVHEALVGSQGPESTPVGDLRNRLPGREDPYDHPVPKLYKTLHSGHMLFSGSPEAEERARIYDGPGQDVINEREQRAKGKAEDDGTQVVTTGGPVTTESKAEQASDVSSQ